MLETILILIIIVSIFLLLIQAEIIISQAKQIEKVFDDFDKLDNFIFDNATFYDNKWLSDENCNHSEVVSKWRTYHHLASNVLNELMKLINHSNKKPKGLLKNKVREDFSKN